MASSDGEAKFWIEPEIMLAENHGIPKRELSHLQKTIEAHEQQIRSAWQHHFG